MTESFGVFLKASTFYESSCFFLGPLGLHKLARSDEGPKALFVGECVGRTSSACIFRFLQDWEWQRMFHAMNCVNNL